jgi:mannose-1-phosphate guanylyltransferase
MTVAAPRDRWSIVLSGGEGERLRPWVERLYGQARPKQYCAFLGGRSMLDHTLARAAAASGAERIITVIGAGHSRYLAQSGASLPGRVIEQPVNRDTAAGILLPLTYVMAENPAATVGIFPSDHYIAPNARFMAHVERAYLLAQRLRNMIVLLGAVPDGPEPDYGWIEPEYELRTGAGPGVRLVRSFREKPAPAKAAMFHRDGYLWNTFIMFAKAEALWTLIGEMLPELRAQFDDLLRVVGTGSERDVLTRIYGTMRPANFSTRILETCADRTLVVTLEGVDWSDWGRPKRIEETFLREGRSLPKVPAVEPAVSAMNAAGT